jgi:hypothetical protein
MSFAKYVLFLISLVTALALSGGSSPAFAKTIEAGDGSASWMGTGEVHDIGDGKLVVNGTLKGVMFVRHAKGAVRGPVHASKLECPVRVITDKKNNSRQSVGVCTLIAHEGQDIAYAQWKYAGPLDECEGEFTFTGGEGGFSGISGATPFRSRIDIERLESGKGQGFGYAYWPNLTYTLP